ncbi:MAG: acyl carrier protein [Myxococcales bacterium]|nr:acyl carrier protein [Myxococcales bacterium]
MAKTESEIQRYIVGKVADALSVAPESVDPDAPLDGLGITSLHAATISGEPARWLGEPLSPTLLWDYPTAAELAGYLGRRSMR